MSSTRLCWLAATIVLSCWCVLQWLWDRPICADGSGSKERAPTHRSYLSLPPKQTTINPIATGHNNASYCQWSVFAGDSNNRMAFEEWIALDRMFTDGRTVRVANRTQMQYTHAWGGHFCNVRWSDKEMLITYAAKDEIHPRCHIVSSRFMIDQKKSVARLKANLTNSSYCDSELENLPLPDGYKRPPNPDMVWYTQGFWGLGGQNRSSCNARFDHVVEAMLHWKQMGIKRVIWQTAFEINWHKEFDNKIINWEYRCQKKLASQLGIELADIYSLVKAAGRQNAVNPGDCHLKRQQRLIPYQYLDRCCGGWESYLGNS